MQSQEMDDQLINDLLISTRPNVHHLLYDEVIALIQTMAAEFSELMTLEAMGKTYDNRDIPMLVIDGANALTPTT